MAVADRNEGDTLHEADFAVSLDVQAAAPRERPLTDLDVANLIDRLESDVWLIPCPWCGAREGTELECGAEALMMTEHAVAVF